MKNCLYLDRINYFYWYNKCNGQIIIGIIKLIMEKEICQYEAF